MDLVDMPSEIGHRVMRAPIDFLAAIIARPPAANPNIIVVDNKQLHEAQQKHGDQRSAHKQCSASAANIDEESHTSSDHTSRNSCAGTGCSDQGPLCHFVFEFERLNKVFVNP